MKIIRCCIEKLARGRKLKRHIHVNGHLAPIYVSPDAQLKYLKLGAAAFDQDLIAIAETFIDSETVVWDIGANVGIFTFAAASIIKNGTVLSVEADIWLAGILRKTGALKEYSGRDIRVLPAALSSNSGVFVFQIAARGRASNALEIAGGSSQMGGIREIQYVPCLTIDTLLENQPEPELIKMDVEGAEALVLSGSTRMLESVRPIFYVEVAPANRAAVEEIMNAQAYKFFSSIGVSIGKIAEPNIFFVPVEKVEYFLEKGATLRNKLKLD